MNRNVWRACCVLCMAILFCCAASATASAGERVRYCNDGDTFVLTSGTKVRLAGINTPEMGHGKRRDQVYAQQSRRLLQSYVKNVELRLKPVGKERDRYGRMIATAYLPDGSMINERMVAEGAAYFYDHKGLPSSLRRTLLKAQRTALKKERGMWAEILESKKADERYIGNKNSKRFFSMPCKEGKRISSRNRVYFSDIEEAFEAGYAPARPCNIWPLESKWF